jgi:hypothetical protein
MAFDWKLIIKENIGRIVQCAKNLPGETVCVLADTNEARNPNGTGGLMKVIVETQLRNAIPVLDRLNDRKMFCLPILKSKLLTLLGPFENTDHIKKLNTGYNLSLWVVCFDGDDRICLDIHAVTPQLN